MTAIRVPPLAPLYPDSGADLFASFGISGNPLPGASLIGLKSATMTPIVGFIEQAATIGSGEPLAAFAAIPSGLLIGRSPSTFGTPTNTFAYRFDGRKVRAAFGTAPYPSFLNAYFDGRALMKQIPAFVGAMQTVDPTLLVTQANDITFASSSATVIAACDQLGYVVGATGVGATATLTLWNPNGSVAWSITINPPSGQTTITPQQLEFGPSGAIYLLSTFGGSVSHPVSSLRQYGRIAGVMNWEVPWTLPIFSTQQLALWVAYDETLFVCRSGAAPASSLAPFAESYSVGGSLQWSTPLWSAGGVAFGTTATNARAGGICEVGGNLFAGMIPFGSHTGAMPITPPLVNVTQLNRTSGAVIGYFSIGPVSSIDGPIWLEPRAGRIGTFGNA